MDIMVRAKWSNKRVGEIPIVFVDRIFGVSNFGSNEVVVFLKGIWELYCEEH